MNSAMLLLAPALAAIQARLVIDHVKKAPTEN